MFFARFLRRNFFAPCGTDVDIYKDVRNEDLNSKVKETKSSALEEIANVKRSRALTMETERCSCSSMSERYSCVSSDSDEEGTMPELMSMPIITLGQISLESRGKYEDIEDRHLDPITLEPLKDPMYVYRSSTGGTTIEYNLASFVDYLLVTGDFRDPITRNKLSEEEIQRLDDVIRREGLIYPLLIEKFRSKANNDSDKTLDNTIRGLESCIGEVICDILGNIETSVKHGNYHLSTLFSELDIPFAEMKLLSLEAAYQALQTWIVFLKGPPKKPTKDTHGRLQFAVAYLEGQWTEEDQKKLEAIRQRH